MAYDRLLRRAVDILIERKFLLVLGILAALGGGPGSTTTWNTSDFGGEGATTPGIPSTPFDQGWPTQFPEFGALEASLLFLILMLICLLFIIGIVVWVISTIASGGLIAGVNTIEEQQPTGFSAAWSEGWQRSWHLVGINLIPSIPMFIMVLIGLFYFGAFVGLAQFDTQEFWAVLGVGAMSTIVCLICIGMPITLVLAALRTFAYRACVLEDQGVVDSYRRGWSVLRDNLTAAIVLFVLQLGLNIVLAVLLFIPTLFIGICCILWPLFLVIAGAITAFFSTVWTLAWREWTGHRSDISIPKAV